MVAQRVTLTGGEPLFRAGMNDPIEALSWGGYRKILKQMVLCRLNHVVVCPEYLLQWIGNVRVVVC